MRKVIALTSIVLLLLLAVSPALASFTKSLPYTNFASLTPITWYQTDKTYKTFKAEIYNNLKWNGTVNPNEYALLRFAQNNTTSAYLEISFNEAGTLRLSYSYDGSVDVPVTDFESYNKSLAVILTLDSEGFLDFWINGGEKQLVKDLSYGNFSLNYIGGHGGTNSTTSSGYVQVYLTEGPYLVTTDVSNSVLMWIPTIITLAMLGVVLGIIKQFGGR